MAGIYIHIPYCKQKCSYCDFYSVIRKNNTEQGEFSFINCLMREIEERSDYLGDDKIETIYFGGGTPTLLSSNEIEILLNNIRSNFNVNNNAEISFEANPDDINEKYIENLLNCGINRVSIGIQAFDDKVLKLLNRRHNVKLAEESVLLCKKAGLNNISGDIIYGIPGMATLQWENTIAKSIGLGIQHISAYMLSYEEGTVMMDSLNKGLIQKISEQEFIKQFRMLVKHMTENKFEHYEISNFALSGFHSIHNSNYWKGKKYIGIGPSAHSYNVKERQWNVRDIDQYMKLIIEKNIYFEKEILDNKVKYNEYILTSLRTIWGVNEIIIKENFGEDYYCSFMENVEKFVEQKLIKRTNNVLRLTLNGMFISDYIIRELIAN